MFKSLSIPGGCEITNLKINDNALQIELCGKALYNNLKPFTISKFLIDLFKTKFYHTNKIRKIIDYLEKLQLQPLQFYIRRGI